jgi:hypothetical protein
VRRGPRVPPHGRPGPARTRSARPRRPPEPARRQLSRFRRESHFGRFRQKSRLHQVSYFSATTATITAMTTRSAATAAVIFAALYGRPPITSPVRALTITCQLFPACR